MRERGLSLVEIVIVISITTVMAMVALPAFMNYQRTARLNGASREVAAAIQEARWRAVQTGWQFRIVGYGDEAATTLKNRFRLIARSSTTVTWPLDTASPTSSSTVIVEPWVNVGTNYPGVYVNPGVTTASGRFVATFDPRGAAIERVSVSPLVVEDIQQRARSVQVSSVGSILFQ